MAGRGGSSPAGQPTPLAARSVSFALTPALHDRLCAHWHGQGPAPPACGVPFLEAQHGANFELWHLEDEARAPGASDADLARVKRRIDQANQRRNDLAEQLDAALLAALAPLGLPRAGAELHSETPGLILDRLSILSLKIFHTREEIERASAPAGHRARNQERLAILAAQREDLAACLARLWSAVLAGERGFRLYRQLKMYNDPELNPRMYS